MSIFHFVAEQLKDVPLFESDRIDIEDDAHTGAIYNDFDRESPFIDTEIPTIEPSQENNRQSQTLSREELDHALLNADKHENAFNIFIDSENFDTTAPVANDEYHDKVINYILVSINETIFSLMSGLCSSIITS